MERSQTKEKLAPAPEQYDPKDFGRVTKAPAGRIPRSFICCKSLFNGGLMNIKSQYGCRIN